MNIESLRFHKSLFLISCLAVALVTEAHVFSLSFKVNALNGDLGTTEGRARAMAWMRANQITKVWLESYRHTEQVSEARLVEVRDAFRKEGFAVSGMITPTQLNDDRAMVCCWTDPKACARLREEGVKAAKVFDEIILDDFLFTTCTCGRCKAEQALRGIADVGDFRCVVLQEVCVKDLLEPGRKTNPNVRFIIKYPCWWRNYRKNGYDPVAEAKLFGACWIGTETRDANPDPLQACWIIDWMDRITEGRCGGGWYDPLKIAHPSKFVEQARYTILGGARESLLHCYDYLLADDPGKAAFNESMDGRKACATAFAAESAGLMRLAKTLEGAVRGPFAMEANKVSRHAFTKDGVRFEAFQNTSGIPAEMTPSFAGRKVLSLPADADATVEPGRVRLAPHAFVLVRAE